MNNRAENRYVALARSITFEAAHHLTSVPEGHKCRGMHGHSYRVRMFLHGTVRADGFVVDNAKIDEFLSGIRAQLDHKCMNTADLEGVSENPTAENLVAWIYDQVPGELHSIFDRLELHEGPDSIFVMKEQGWPNHI